MIEVLSYNPRMFPAVALMHKTQGYSDMASIESNSLPAIGAIAYKFDAFTDIGAPVAACFLRMVEGGFAQMDTFVTNANASSELRHEGINACVDKLIIEAKKLKLLGILATTKDESTIMRAQSLGFHVVTDHKVIALSLKEPPGHG